MSAAGTLLLCRNKDMTAHATITGLQLKSGGATKFTHKRFHARSLSVSYTTTLQKQESLGIGFDEDVRRWKKEMEEDFERRKECQVHVEMLEHKIAEGSHEFSDVLQWRKLKEESRNLEESRHPGFMLVGDNIDFVTKPRHQTSERGKKDLHYFNFFAVKNKVRFNTYLYMFLHQWINVFMVMLVRCHLVIMR